METNTMLRSVKLVAAGVILGCVASISVASVGPMNACAKNGEPCPGGSYVDCCSKTCSSGTCVARP